MTGEPVKAPRMREFRAALIGLPRNAEVHVVDVNGGRWHAELTWDEGRQVLEVNAVEPMIDRRADA